MLNLNLNEPGWIYGVKFSRPIDFCVWVLETDGLRVPPFNKHQEGNKALRARGLEAETWQSWLTKVIQCQDPWLAWYWDKSSHNQQLWVEEQLAEFEEVASLANDQIDVSAVRSSLEKLWVRNEQRYQQAAARVGLLPENPLVISPADVWVGELAVGERLRELWTHYNQALWNERGREVEAIENCPKNRSSQERARMIKLRQDLKPYCTRLVGLEIYFVNYSTPVTYLVPPQSAVLSTTNGLPESEAFHECVLRVAEALVVANSSL